MGRPRRSDFAFEKKEQQKQLSELDGKFIFAAGYCRLSVDKEEETSIENQKAVIEAYMAKHPDIKLQEFFVDDGVTGTTMDRPAWMEMMKQLYQGKFQCIVVKDLSRFGRNYVETGYYLEHIFPKMGVRFIACLDELDTQNIPDGAPVKIKNLVNDYYARDISRKITAVFAGQRERGELVRNPVYGYTLDGGKRIPDPETAPLVKMMFTWAELGATMSQIADRLTLMGVKPPLEEGGAFLPGDEMVPWYPGTVRRILMNETMTGAFVSGKVTRRMHKATTHEEDEWTVIEGHHEGIISPEQFAAVQEQIGKAMGSKDGNTGYLKELDGKIFCGVCGQRMTVKARNKERKHVTYACFKHNGKICTRKEYERLDKAPAIKETALLEMIEKEAERIKAEGAEFRRAVSGAEDLGGLLEKPRKELILAKQAKEAAIRERDDLLETYSKGKLDTQTYMLMRGTLTEKCEKMIADLEEKISRLHQMETDIERAKKDLREMDDALEMVQRVDVFPDGTAKIVFKAEQAMENIRRWIK